MGQFDCNCIREMVSINEINFFKTNTHYFELTVSVLSRHSKTSLYNQNLVSMDVQGDFEPKDVGGFIRTQAYRLKEFNRFKKQCDI